MNEDNVVLQVKNLSVLIKDRFLVKNVNFEVKQGECWAFIGEDKSGKTSLLKAVSGSLPINPCQVYILGKDIHRNKKVLTQVSTCFDPPVFFKYQTVYQNFKYIAGLSESANKENIIKILNRFGIAHKMHTRVLFLSYYERKLMALALGFLTKPKLLLLDEPFKNLPPEHFRQIKDAIEDVRAQGTAVLIATRSLENVENICNKFVFMKERAIEKILTKDELDNMQTLPTYAFVRVKYPHYAGKLVIDNFNLQVKVLDKRILFEANEDLTAQIVMFLTKNKIAIYRAGYMSRKEEKILASLAPYFKEDKSEEDL